MAEAVKDDWRQIIILDQFRQCPIDDLPLDGSAAGRSKYKVEVHIFLPEQLLEIFYVLMPFHKHFRNRLRQGNFSDAGLWLWLFQYQIGISARHRRRELEH